MIVVCINNYVYSPVPFTIGKRYEVLESTVIPNTQGSTNYYSIIDDCGFQRYTLCSNFRDLTIEEIREDKLNQLLND